MKNIGILYSQQGEDNEALKYLKRALEIEIKEFGREDLTTANTLSNLGVAYAPRGNHEEAIRLSQVASNVTK